ncbi:MAG: DUF1318 domain-containing protein [Candidatus Rokubacteria bacterium]|nr:DUF1318 domain-containing protein [Candidatus Rokubacteria bacterium]
MLTRHLRHLPLLGLASLLAACVPVTVNINFPQEKLEGAATRIEDMVRSPENPKPPAAPKKGPQGGLGDRLLAALAPRDSAAQSRSVDVVPEIRVQTPQLMQAIGSRRARNPQIDQWKARGCIGEANQGLLEARPGQGCSGEGASLIGAENADRNFIYETLMQQNHIPAGDGPRVRAAFAKVNRELARPGEWVQQPNGQWVRK